MQIYIIVMYGAAALVLIALAATLGKAAWLAPRGRFRLALGHRYERSGGRNAARARRPSRRRIPINGFRHGRPGEIRQSFPLPSPRLHHGLLPHSAKPCFGTALGANGPGVFRRNGELVLTKSQLSGP
jgi:hypothetical protein